MSETQSIDRATHSTVQDIIDLNGMVTPAELMAGLGEFTEDEETNKHSFELKGLETLSLLFS